MSIPIFLDAERSQVGREALLLRLAFLFLAGSAFAIAIAPAARLGAWSIDSLRLEPLAVLPIWAVLAWLVRRTADRHTPNRDPYLLPVGMLLTGWGMLLIWRLSPVFGARQTGWFFVASVLLLEILRGPSDMRWLRRYRYLWLLGGLLLVGLTLFFGTNPSGGDPRLWLGCCGLYLQPSEPLRLLLVGYLAAYLSDRMALGWSHKHPRLGPTLAPLLVVWGLSVALLFVQRDLGTATLFLGVLAVLLYVASGRWQVLAVAGIFGVAGGVMGNFLVPIVRLRLMAWLQPWIDPIGNAYQTIQALIAMASGGILGSGPGLGAPGFVPVAHTDFVFAAAVEEWGMIGGIALIMLFAVFISRGITIALRTGDPFSALLAVGLSVTLGLQAVLIIGGVTRLLPLTGVTLPFVSYGGSSLVTSFIAMAMLLKVSGSRDPRRRALGPLQNVQLGLAAAWVALAIALGWWGLVRAGTLQARTDNPRRALAERFSPRGHIMDRSGAELATTLGVRGSYERTYASAAVASVVGYDSARYGQAGIEQSMDPFLRGEAGYDPFAIWWQRALTSAPPAGLDVRLTIDLALQQRTADLLGGLRGAVVLLDPATGDILALVSSPSFDPNQLDDAWSSLIESPDAPLLNRASQSVYQPGTIMNPFILAWATQQEITAPDRGVGDLTVSVALDGLTVRCASEPHEGVAPTLGSAARFGCPAPFAEIAATWEPTDLIALIQAFQLETPVLLRLPAGAGADVELPESPSAQRSMALGQGALTVNPLQLARAFAALAAGGTLPPMRIVDAVQTPAGDWERLPAQEDRQPLLDPAVANRVLQSMRTHSGTTSGAMGRAVLGDPEIPLAWYLGASMDAAPTRIVVVVLEEAGPEEAQRIGILLLQASSGLP